MESFQKFYGATNSIILCGNEIGHLSYERLLTSLLPSNCARIAIVLLLTEGVRENLISVNYEVQKKNKTLQLELRNGRD